MMGDNQRQYFQDCDEDKTCSLPMQVVLDGKRRVEEFLNFVIGLAPNRNGNKQKYQVENTLAGIVNMRKQLGNASVESIKRDELGTVFIAKMCNDERVGVQTEMEVRVIKEGHSAGKSQGKNFGRKFETAQHNREELETKNMFECWDYFSELHRSTGKTLLTLTIILEGHRILMRDLLPSPGEMSVNKRWTTCPVMNKRVHYPSPEFVSNIIYTLLDYANQITVYLDEEIKQGLTGELVLLSIKLQAWFFASFIMLHPFSDGNGRMSRMLLAYLQLSLSPVPVGLYSLPSKAADQAYIEALVEVRRQHEEHKCCQENWCLHSRPLALGGMLLECLWHTWRNISDGSTRELGPTLFANK